MCDAVDREDIDLPLGAESAGRARRFILEALCAAHCQSVVADAVLLTSELVTNATVHGGPPIKLSVECRGDAVEIRVRDGSPDPPVRRTPSRTDTGGRGLQLVDGLSTEWGVDRAVGGGKETWFRLAAG